MTPLRPDYLFSMNALHGLDPNEVPAFYHGYIKAAEGSDPIDAINAATVRTGGTILRIPGDRADHRYAPGKWSIKEVLQHVIDSERVFSYRALRFARNDATELPGFDENLYAPNADAGRRDLKTIVDELNAVRASSLALFQSFTPEMFLRAGNANGNRISVRALGWVIAGHAVHHMNVIEQRYLLP